MALPTRIHVQGLLPSNLNGYYEESYGEFYHVDDWNVVITPWWSDGWYLLDWNHPDTEMFFHESTDSDTLPLTGWQELAGSFDVGGMVITDYSDITPYKPSRLTVSGFDGPGDGVYYNTWSGYTELGGGIAILFKDNQWVFEDASEQILASCAGNPWVLPLTGWDLAITITESVCQVTISSIYELQGIQFSGMMDLEYVQTQDIDATPTNPGSGNYDASVWTSAGFVPIGTSTSPFVGQYDGQHFEIDGLYINRSTLSGCGLFGIVGAYGYGYLPRRVRNTHIRNCYVRGSSGTGGLVGSVTASGRIEDCSATGTVVGTAYVVGGLVGHSVVAYTRRCWADVAVSMTGTNRNAGGGLFGAASYTSSVKDCYARGVVQGNNNNYIGGFIGRFNHGDVRVERCYSTGLATGNIDVGQFNGWSASELAVAKDCYWVSDDPESTSLNGIRLSTAEAKDMTAYGHFDFLSLWNLDPANEINNGYPYLDPRQVPPLASPGLYRSVYRKR